MPYQVPESRIFVMGDHRLTSVDSRTTVVGCIAEEYIIGKVIFRLWPWEKIGTVG
jgi:signal peptidase I